MRAGEHQDLERNRGGWSPRRASRWMDAETYPKANSLNDTFWRWEFLRRRSDYRDDWERYFPSSYEFDLACSKDPNYPTRYNKPVFTPDHPAFKARMPNSLEKYHLSGLPNPAIAKPWMLSFDPEYGRIYFGHGPDWLAGGEEISLCLPEWKVAVVFDLKRSLTTQIEKVEADLREWQSHQAGQKLERRKRRDDWPLYLRVLDAVEAGVSYAEVGRRLLHIEDDEEAAARIVQLHKHASQLSVHFPD